jgi:hypothetical protein
MVLGPRLRFAGCAFLLLAAASALSTGHKAKPLYKILGTDPQWGDPKALTDPLAVEIDFGLLSEIVDSPMPKPPTFTNAGLLQGDVVANAYVDVPKITTITNTTRSRAKPRARGNATTTTKVTMEKVPIGFIRWTKAPNSTSIWTLEGISLRYPKKQFTLVRYTVYLIVNFDLQFIIGRVAHGNVAHSFDTIVNTSTTVTTVNVTEVYCSMPAPGANVGTGPRRNNSRALAHDHHHHHHHHDHSHDLFDYEHHAAPAHSVAVPPDHHRQLQVLPPTPPAPTAVQANYLIWLDNTPPLVAAEPERTFFAAFGGLPVIMTRCPATAPVYGADLDFIERMVGEMFAPFNVAFTRDRATWEAHLDAGNNGIHVMFVGSANPVFTGSDATSFGWTPAVAVGGNLALPVCEAARDCQGNIIPTFLQGIIGVPAQRCRALEATAQAAMFKRKDNGVWIHCLPTVTDVLAYGRVVAHEVGHTFGLSHDSGAAGAPGVLSSSNGFSYLDGLPNPANGVRQWNPIMATSKAGNIVHQWSKGEYTGADNQQDDLEIIGAVTGLKPRPDYLNPGNTPCDLVYSPATPALPYVDLAMIIPTFTFETVPQLLYCAGGAPSHTWYFRLPAGRLRIVLNTATPTALRARVFIGRGTFTGRDGLEGRQFFPIDNPPFQLTNTEDLTFVNPSDPWAADVPVNWLSSATSPFVAGQIVRVSIVATAESGRARPRANQASYAFPIYGSIGTYTLTVTGGIAPPPRPPAPPAGGPPFFPFVPARPFNPPFIPQVPFVPRQ